MVKEREEGILSSFRFIHISNYVEHWTSEHFFTKTVGKTNIHIYSGQWILSWQNYLAKSNWNHTGPNLPPDLQPLNLTQSDQQPLILNWTTPIFSVYAANPQCQRWKHQQVKRTTLCNTSLVTRRPSSRISIHNLSISPQKMSMKSYCLANCCIVFTSVKLPNKWKTCLVSLISRQL